MDQVLRIFLCGRKGDILAAAEILAKSLIWREQYKDRAEKWVTSVVSFRGPP